MKIVLFLIGFAVGTLVLYVLKMKDMDRLDQLETELKKARQDFTNAEEEHEQRLKEAIATLQDDYQKKQDQRILNIKAEYQIKINALEAQLGSNNALEPQAAHREADLVEIDPPTSSTPLPHRVRPSRDITQIPATFEPPILAADIQSLSTKPALIPSTPSGKQIDPPILAQKQTL